MAQTSSKRFRRMRLLTKRYGLWGSKGVALACVATVLVLGALGLMNVLMPQTVTIERDAVVAQERENTTSVADSSSNSASSHKEEQELLVHVDGAVCVPGVYRVTGSTPRVNDAVELAGGLTEQADTTGLNLAAPLEDGQKIHVPTLGETPSSDALGSVVAQAPLDAQSNENQGLVNINTATEDELQELEGVGEATSADIVKERESNGPFASPEDIMRVSGIGQKKFEKMKDQICV